MCILFLYKVYNIHIDLRYYNRSTYIHTAIPRGIQTNQNEDMIVIVVYILATNLGNKKAEELKKIYKIY